MIEHKGMNQVFEIILNNSPQYELFKRLYTTDNARIVVTLDAIKTYDKEIAPSIGSIYIYTVIIDINYNKGFPETVVITKQFIDVINAYKYIANIIENDFNY